MDLQHLSMWQHPLLPFLEYNVIMDGYVEKWPNNNWRLLVCHINHRDEKTLRKKMWHVSQRCVFPGQSSCTNIDHPHILNSIQPPDLAPSEYDLFPRVSVSNNIPFCAMKIEYKLCWFAEQQKTYLKESL